MMKKNLFTVFAFLFLLALIPSLTTSMPHGKKSNNSLSKSSKSNGQNSSLIFNKLDTRCGSRQDIRIDVFTLVIIEVGNELIIDLKIIGELEKDLSSEDNVAIVFKSRDSSLKYKAVYPAPILNDLLSGKGSSNSKVVKAGKFEVQIKVKIVNIGLFLFSSPLIKMEVQSSQGSRSCLTGVPSINNKDSSYNNQGSSYNNQGSSSNNQGSSYNNQGSSYSNQGSSSNNQGSSYNNQGSSANNQNSSSNDQSSSANNQNSWSNSSANNQTSSSNNQTSSSDNQISSSNNQTSSSGNQY